MATNQRPKDMPFGMQDLECNWEKCGNGNTNSL